MRLSIWLMRANCRSLRPTPPFTPNRISSMHMMQCYAYPTANMSRTTIAAKAAVKRGLKLDAKWARYSPIFLRRWPILWWLRSVVQRWPPNAILSSRALQAIVVPKTSNCATTRWLALKCGLRLQALAIPTRSRFTITGSNLKPM